MKPSSWDKQLGLALPQECAASQSDQTVNPSKNEVRNGGGAGCKSPHPHLSEGRGEVFSLDILFHRISVIAFIANNRIGSELLTTRPSMFFHEKPEGGGTKAKALLIEVGLNFSSACCAQTRFPCISAAYTRRTVWLVASGLRCPRGCTIPLSL